jgi:UDP-glucose-4-epimerase GalE
LEGILNILVTGGAGYIGSHACKVLAADGHNPITYDNLSRGNAHAVKWGPLEAGEIGDANRLRDVLEKYRPGALMHFAAYAYVGESVREPLMYYQNNFASTASLLRTIIEFQPIPIVFSSTCATYGIPNRVPIEEEQEQRPINPYGRSKLFVEHLLKDLGATYGLQWVALRYFNAAGADPQGEIGEEHDPETHLVPLAIKAAITGEPLRVFGTDYDTIDGTCVRDFIHVNDIAEAHLLALKYLLAGGKSCALNLANAKGYSVKEVISAVERVSGSKVPVEFEPRRAGDPAVLVGDASRAHALLDWKPRRSGLDAQISDAYSWFRRASIRAGHS